jgi:hypothetical protein
MTGISFGVPRLCCSVAHPPPEPPNALQCRLESDEASRSARFVQFVMDPLQKPESENLQSRSVETLTGTAAEIRTKRAVGDLEPDYQEFPAWLALALGAAHLPVPLVYLRQN